MSYSTSPEDFSANLLHWYDNNKRALPWRDRQDDPYAVWVSEIMLQQTTVAAVIPFYLRWMAAFPTVQALANADLQQVLTHWAGLGYYARARNLKRAAEVIVDEFEGVLPNTVEGLVALPGIGRYTAGAIASIAYSARAPILDANVMRVYGRVEALDIDIDSSAGQSRLWEIAETKLPTSRCGDFNQALMELGATICSPGAPSCGQCPVQSSCKAHKLGDPTVFPVRSKKTRWVDVEDCAVAIERGGALLFVKRPEIGLWGGLWELPRTTREANEALDECATRSVAETVGLVVKLGGAIGTIKHTVMNRRMKLHGFRGEVEPNAVPAIVKVADARWVTVDDIPSYPLSSPQQSLVALWLATRGQGQFSL